MTTNQPSLKETIDRQQELIDVHGFKILTWDDDSLWLESSEGEGMQISKAVLHTILERMFSIIF